MSETIVVKVYFFKDRKNLVLGYVDPISNKLKTQSAKTADEGEAWKAAERWETELRNGKFVPRSKLTWSDFRRRYREEHLVTFKPKGRESAECALNQVQKLLNPDRLAKVNASALSLFASKLRKQGSKETTIASVLRTVRAALGWAKSVGLLADVPTVTLPKQAKGKKMKGRPLVLEEHEKMLTAVEKVRPGDAADWRRFLTGLWLSGLRLAEACILSWETDAPFSIDLGGRHPRLRIRGNSQKSGKDELLPLTPDFAAFLLETPQQERHGRVFRLNAMGANIPLDHHRVGEIVTVMGGKAGIIVNRGMKRDPETGKEKEVIKYASCHDYRRSFATRWARRVKTPTLQKLCRHASINTTLSYYVDIDCDEVADELYANYPAENNSPAINTSINNTPEEDENEESPATVNDCQALTYVSEGDGTRTRNHRIDSPVL